MIITVEGNIGAGKSIFCGSLYNLLLTWSNKVVYLEEPVEIWKNVGGKNLLQLYYEDKIKWAFTFQVNALQSMIELENKAITLSQRGCIVIRERSPFSVIEIFSMLLCNENLLDSVQMEILIKLKTSLFRKPYKNSQDYVIYLRVLPDINKTRIEERNRLEEVGKVDINYLKNLHDLHEEKLFKIPSENLLIIDGESYSEDDIQVAKITNIDISLGELCQKLFKK